jgi:superfamily II DNA/RNA helicase
LGYEKDISEIINYLNKDMTERQTIMLSATLTTPASSTTKTGRHDLAGILLKVALNTINQIKSN